MLLNISIQGFPSRRYNVALLSFNLPTAKLFAYMIHDAAYLLIRKYYYMFIR